MGNSCAPDKPKEEAPVTDMDKKAALEEATQPGEAQPGEKFTQIINSYQAENERLKKEVDELKTQETERAAKQSDDQTTESDKLLQELNTMRALIAAKDNDLVKSRLEAALHSRATTMLSGEKNAKQLIAENLEKFGRGGRGSAKAKYVEVNLHKGEHVSNGFEPGVIRLHYSDTKESSQRSTGRVIKVKTASNVPSKYQGRTFSITAQVEGAAKELVFACADAKSRDKWVDTFKAGFSAIEQEARDMNALFQLVLEFNKDKLGIRVEEKVIDKPAGGEAEAEAEEPEQEKKEDVESEADKTEDKADAAEKEDQDDDLKPDDEPAPAYTDDAAKEEGEPAAAAEPAAAEAAAAEPVAAADKAEEAVAEPAAEEEEKEPACTLVVTAISDEDLASNGLVEQMSLVALNEHKLDGLPYSKQLNLLTTTDKPFKITFSGPKYLKLASSGMTAYPAILKQLIAEETNPSQKAFQSIIKGTTFEKELEASEDPNALIKELLGDQRRLTALLQSVTVQVADL